ncbi:hypothetical protein RFI_09564, partial [Reticulomyxa filosa]
MATDTTDWNYFRTECIRLENEINSKLAEYEKVGITITIFFFTGEPRKIQKVLNNSPNSTPLSHPSSNSLTRNQSQESDKNVQRLIADSDNVLRDVQNLLKLVTYVHIFLKNEFVVAAYVRNHKCLSTLNDTLVDKLDKSESGNTSMEYTLSKCRQMKKDFTGQLNRAE